jgi:hypothetical protein
MHQRGRKYTAKGGEGGGQMGLKSEQHTIQLPVVCFLLPLPCMLAAASCIHASYCLYHGNLAHYLGQNFQLALIHVKEEYRFHI